MSTSPNRNKNLLYPPFRARLDAGLAAVRMLGLHPELFEGWRSTERQAFLYAQGRSTPGAIVTWARPGESLHEYGLGGDIVFDGSPAPGVQWSWEGDYADLKKDAYAILAPQMKAHGLEWLGDKNIERAHFQFTLGLTLAEIQQLTKARGILGLWDELDRRLAAKNQKGVV